MILVVSPAFWVVQGDPLAATTTSIEGTRRLAIGFISDHMKIQPIAGFPRGIARVIGHTLVASRMSPKSMTADSAWVMVVTIRSPARIRMVLGFMGSLCRQGKLAFSEFTEIANQCGFVFACHLASLVGKSGETGNQLLFPAFVGAIFLGCPVKRQGQVSCLTIDSPTRYPPVGRNKHSPACGILAAFRFAARRGQAGRGNLSCANFQIANAPPMVAMSAQ